MNQLGKQYLIQIANPSTLTASPMIDVPWNQTTVDAVIDFVAANAEPDIADRLHVIDYHKIGDFNEEKETFLLLIKLDLKDIFEASEIEEYQRKISIV
jgi:hypothetical protein